jgi:hypothetical protein
VYTSSRVFVYFFFLADGGFHCRFAFAFYFVTFAAAAFLAWPDR